eukprot:scaffold3161_cov118-Isochrysis_galbana.AAC.2
MQNVSPGDRNYDDTRPPSRRVAAPGKCGAALPTRPSPPPPYAKHGKACACAARLRRRQRSRGPRRRRGVQRGPCRLAPRRGNSRRARHCLQPLRRTEQLPRHGVRIPTLHASRGLRRTPGHVPHYTLPRGRRRSARHPPTHHHLLLGLKSERHLANLAQETVGKGPAATVVVCAHPHARAVPHPSPIVALEPAAPAVRPIFPHTLAVWKVPNETSLKHGAVREGLPAVPMSLSVGPAAHVPHPLRSRVGALAMPLTRPELALVLTARRRRVVPVPLKLVPHKPALVLVPRSRDPHALPVPLARHKVAFVPRLARPVHPLPAESVILPGPIVALLSRSRQPHAPAVPLQLLELTSVVAVPPTDQPATQQLTALPLARVRVPDGCGQRPLAVPIAPRPLTAIGLGAPTELPQPGYGLCCEQAVAVPKDGGPLAGNARRRSAGAAGHRRRCRGQCSGGGGAGGTAKLATVLREPCPVLLHFERRVEIILLGLDGAPDALLAHDQSTTLPFALPGAAAVGGASRSVAVQSASFPGAITR